MRRSLTVLVAVLVAAGKRTTSQEIVEGDWYVQRVECKFPK